MKRLIILPIIYLGLLLSSCNKEDNNISKDNFQYEATVIGQGMDCGETFTISLKSIKTNTDFEDGTYYADNLSSDLKVEGLKIYLNCRELNNDEIYACTMWGPTYPHVFVTESKKADE